MIAPEKVADVDCSAATRAPLLQFKRILKVEGFKFYTTNNIEQFLKRSLHNTHNVWLWFRGTV